MCSKSVSIDVTFSTPVVTSQASGIILTTFIEFLYYYTKQMPFAFDTMKVMATKIRGKISNEGNNSDDLFNMQMERQQRLALDTFDSLKSVLENVANQLDNQEFHQALILFGPTSLSPKEAFLINIPPITKNHYSINHQESIRNVARDVLKSIVTSKKLFEIESKLSATNMFVLLRPKVHSVNNDSFQLNEGFRLRRNCKIVCLNLMNMSAPLRTNCCEDLVVYNDMVADYRKLNVTNKNVESIEIDGQIVDDMNHLNDINNGVWYESTIFVRGFKDVLVKGKSIWNV